MKCAPNCRHKGASGIILQRMDINSRISCLRSVSYWEMWKAVDGKVAGNEYGWDIMTNGANYYLFLFVVTKTKSSRLQTGVLNSLQKYIGYL